MLKSKLIYISLILNKGLIMKKIIATLVALVFSTSAYAVTISDFSIGASFNHGLYGAEGKEENYTHTGSIESTNIKEGAFVDDYAQIFVEAALTDNLSLGISYTPSEISTPKNVNPEPDGDITVVAEFEELTTLYLLGKTDLGIYGKLGYSQMDINITTENVTGYNDTDTDGFELAVGYEHDAGNGFGVRLELAYSEFDSVKADNGATTNVNKNEITVSDMRGATGRVSLVKSF